MIDFGFTKEYAGEQDIKINRHENVEKYTVFHDEQN